MQGWMGAMAGVTLALMLAGAGEADAGPMKPPRVGDPTELTEAELLDLRYRAQEAARALEEERYAEADAMYTGLVRDRNFGRLAKSSRAHLLRGAAHAALGVKDLRRAQLLFRQAGRLDPDDGAVVWWLVVIALDLEQPEVAAAETIRLAGRWPQLLDHFHEHTMFGLLHLLPESAPVRRELLQALFDAGWTQRGLGGDYFWYQLALSQLADGDIEAARTVVARIENPEILVDLRIDRRFDPLVDHIAPAFDIGLAARNFRDRLQARAEAEPNDISRWRDLTYAQLTLGEHEAVLETVAHVQALLASNPKLGDPLSGTQDEIWVLNNRSIALQRLGRHEEALADLDRARGMTEHGQPNISQALNYGVFLVGLGRPEEALAAVASVRGMSGYGQMVQASVRFGAALQLGDEALAAEALAHLRAHRDEGPVLLLSNLLRAGDLDAASDVLLELLDSDKHRVEVLGHVQDYLRAPGLPANAASRTHRDALLARPEVRAAIERVGRIESHPIYRLAGG